MVNNFNQLDAQNDTSSFAQFTTEEHAEYQAWVDQHVLPRDSAGEPTPADVDGSGASSDMPYDRLGTNDHTPYVL